MSKHDKIFALFVISWFYTLSSFSAVKGEPRLMEPIPLIDSQVQAAPQFASYSIMKQYGDSRFFQGGHVTVACFSPDGQYIAVGAERLTGELLTIWSIQGNRLHDFPLSASALQYSSDGKFLYFLTDDGIVGRYNTTTWERADGFSFSMSNSPSVEPENSADSRPRLRLTPHNSIIVWDQEQTFYLLHAETFALQKTKIFENMLSFSISPDGSKMAVYSFERQIMFYDTETGQEINSFHSESATWSFPLLIFRHDNNFFAIAQELTIQLYNLQTNTVTIIEIPEPDNRLSKNHRFHKEKLRIPVYNNIEPIPKLLCSSAPSFDQLATSYSSIPRAIYSLLFTHNSSSIFITTAAGNGYIIDFTTGNVIHHAQLKGSFILDHNDSTLILLGTDMSARMVLYRFPELKPLIPIHRSYSNGKIFFMPDKKHFISIGEASQLRIFDVETARVVTTLDHIAGIEELVFINDGAKMITVGPRMSASVRIWDTRTWTLEHTLANDLYLPQALALNHDETLIFVGDSKGRCIAWDLNNYQPRHTFSLFGDKYTPEIIAIAAGINRLVLSTNIGTAEVFQWPSKQRLGILSIKPLPDVPLAHYTRAISFSSGEKRLATASTDGIIYFWDSESLAPLGTIPNSLIEVYFQLPKSSLQFLVEDGVPHDVVTQLQPLQDGAFMSEDDFVKAIQAHIGKQLTLQYKSLILTNAHKSSRRGWQDIAVTPGGRFVLLTGWNGVYLYEIETRTLVFACDDYQFTNIGDIALQDDILTVTVGTKGCYGAITLVIDLGSIKN